MCNPKTVNLLRNFEITKKKIKINQLQIIIIIIIMMMMMMIIGRWLHHSPFVYISCELSSHSMGSYQKFTF